jgi:hypothetical protein
MITVSDAEISKFMSQVELAPTGCWIWTGIKTVKGYGRFKFQYKDWRAHRWIYNFMAGELDSNLVIDHLCHNKLCVNPFHLEQVTDQVNEERKVLGLRRTHCYRGHEYTPENTYVRAYGRGCRTCARESYSRRKS